MPSRVPENVGNDTTNILMNPPMKDRLKITVIYLIL